MGSRRRSKKGGRRRRRPGRLPAAAAQAVLRRFDKVEAEGVGGKGSTPSCFVIRRGRLTPAARQLVRDMRRVMLPHCGERLRERRSSKLKDYVAAASLLGVTHLQLFTQTDAGLYFKLVQLPAGPTLSFRVLRFSLIHDVQRYYQQQKRRIPRAPDSRDFLHPPLLILSPQAVAAATRKRQETSGSAEADKTKGKEGQHQQDVEALIARVVKSAFPPIDIRTVELRDCRRVVLFRRESGTPSNSSASSSFSGSGSTTSGAPMFHYQLRQYAVVRRLQDGTQIVTPGVRALVEAGSSRVAADRMLQQRFGISLQGENSISPADNANISVYTKRNELSRKCNSALGVTETETETTTASEEAEGRQRRKQKRNAELENEEHESDVNRSSSGSQDSIALETSSQHVYVWRDICEATLAREHAAAADTDDEQCLSFGVSEVKTSGAVGSAQNKSTGRRTKDGLLWLSVAAAAHHRGKKEGDSNGAAGSAFTEDEGNTPGVDLTNENESQVDGDMDAGHTELGDAGREGAGGIETDEAVSNPPKEEKLKMKVSLVELGPRMHLELVKVEEDVCAGAVLFHNFVKKTSEELSALLQKDAALRQQREKERAAVQDALKKQLQKRKRRENVAEGSCGESGDDEAEATGSSAEEETDGPVTSLKSTTASNRDRAEGDCASTGRDLASGKCSSKRKKVHFSSGQLHERKGAVNQGPGTLSEQDFLNERPDGLNNASASGAAADDNGVKSSRPKGSVKRKRDSTVNAESKTPCKQASAVFRRYEAATACQRGDP